jgi:hypothetical protein
LKSNMERKTTRSNRRMLSAIACELDTTVRAEWVESSPEMATAFALGL